MPRPTVRLDPRAAELRLALEADSREELFLEAARVVSRESGDASGPPGEWALVRLSAPDPATLLVEWINDLIGRSEIEHRALGEVRGLRLVEGAAGPEAATVEAEVRGPRVTEYTSPIKAATLHGLTLGRSGARWRAEVLLDV
jgi:SHS2 domain-containing protein